MSISVMGMILPAAFQAQVSRTSPSAPSNILAISRYTAGILLFVYVIYLMFQLRTHAHLYLDEAEEGGEEGGEHEEEEPTIGSTMAFGTLICSTLLVAICAEGLVSAIEGVSKEVGMGSIFVGFILL